ncbi:MAG: maleylpyruvate isomerase family mycothiol-dependent enzyme [Actinophytocola sp.]|uniref:maleylpyruvate isomerase N-terminal domain-containing protein n=1 Tax=Actinophytocola sp. TaxID=1872138 RepID=UPI00132AC1CE|nr:maleylpyruvate isomerase N-terminal domain-containing protein [Actinophytocola sp.]MPZ79772.1 maleylpyruvate isomerase family mycothiol-dependent enzyme [Actinophytocola sp.]
MDFASYLRQVERQAGALRAAVVAAGPDATVPTCPEWTVRALVRHIARVHDWALQALRADPAGERPERARPPEDWADLLAWWDHRVATLLDTLKSGGPDAPAWVFHSGTASTAAFWARRQAHETAIHRLDAEHARAGSDGAAAVPSLVFEPELAADGIDELLVLMIPRKLARERPDVEGTVLFHAADAGRAWTVRLEPGRVPQVTASAEVESDASVVGTADAVYRAAWRRPSTAVTTGDRTLVDALRTP